MVPLRKLEPKLVERRRHQRVGIVLLGRYMLSDRQEYPCQSIDMSPGGLGLIAPVSAEPGERVVCYLDQLGRIEGTISRRFDNGFALRFNVPLIKREKLADQLTWFANRNSLGMPEDRRHERIVPRNNRSTLVFADGRELAVKLIDVSRSGAAVLSDIRPAIGTPVAVGKSGGRVARVFGNGFAVEFSRTIPAEQFSEDITL